MALVIQLLHTVSLQVYASIWLNKKVCLARKRSCMKPRAVSPVSNFLRL